MCMICSDDRRCVLNGHESLSVETWVENENHRPEMRERVADVEELKQRFEDGMAAIDRMEGSLQRAREAAEAEIQTRHDNLVVQLGLQRDELLNRTALLYDRKKDRLDDHREKLRKAHQVISESTKFIKDFLAFANNVEFYYERTRLSARLESLQHEYENYCTEPQENDEITFLENRSFSIDRAIGTVRSTPCVEHFALEDPQRLQNLRVGLQTTVTVTCRDICDTLVPGNLPHLCAFLEEPEHPADGVCYTTPCHIMRRNRHGTYRITMLPYQEGPMRLHVFHERPKPFENESIRDCGNQGFGVAVKPAPFFRWLL